MKYQVEMVRKFGTAVFKKAGLTHEDAEICMDSFIQSDLRGIRTHGVTHLKGYCDRLELGTVSADKKLEIVETSCSTLTVDAGNTIGMAAASKVMDRCVEKAKISGTCFATVHNGCHFGFGGYFPMKAAERGMIGICVANSPALVVPFGGADRLLGTNPISVAIPAGKYPAFVLDMATSLVAKGKISLALKEGREIPLGWALDKDGNPTAEAKKADEGALLPMGGAKGYGLALLVAILSSALAGGASDWEIPGFWTHPEVCSNIGYFMGAIDISKFVPLEIFKEAVDKMFEKIKRSRPAPGFLEVMIPGEIEFHAVERNRKEGIEISDVTLKEFQYLSQKYEVMYPF